MNLDPNEIDPNEIDDFVFTLKLAVDQEGKVAIIMDDGHGDPWIRTKWFNDFDREFTTDMRDFVTMTCSGMVQNVVDGL